MITPDFSSMNPGSRPSASPRLSCRIVRRWCALTSTRDSRHVASCADCQAYFKVDDALERALRRDACEASREVAADSGALERDIIRAVRQSAASRASSRSTTWSNAWTVGGFAAVASVAIAIGFFQREPRPIDRVAFGEPMPTRADAEEIVNAVGSFSDQLVDSVIPSAGELVAKNPMQQEIGSVYSDMRSALNFLALNFLPKTPDSRPTRSSG